MTHKKPFLNQKTLEYFIIILSAVVFITAASSFIIPQTEYGFDKPNFIFLGIITFIDIICFITLKFMERRHKSNHKTETNKQEIL